MSAVPLTRPPRLRPGDRVAVVTPAGPGPKDLLERGCALLREWGLEVTIAPHALDVREDLPYLAGADADRAADLQAAWLDPEVAGVLCARGGYGAQRMTDLLDWPAMREVPAKVFVGYSDITALHEAFATQLGVVTVHGPMVGFASFVEGGDSAERLRALLFEPDTQQTLTSASAESLAPGTARGVTMGGCLSIIAADVGTPTARPGAAGGIAVLEDLEEDNYRLDRMLTQLLRAGWFDDIAGIALGSWVDCPDNVRDLMLDRLGPLGVPMVWELGFGHCSPTLTIPLGVAATLDADAATLTLDEPALR
ncbi:MAG TPA: LD-carboxypeptidase [Nocardioides sp.]|nr:LD-carboxypeptidase [Nocardioides sp.]